MKIKLFSKQDYINHGGIERSGGTVYKRSNGCNDYNIKNKHFNKVVDGTIGYIHGRKYFMDETSITYIYLDTLLYAVVEE